MDDPRWARPALLCLLAATALLYLANLTVSGWANAFYSAAAQAGSVSRKAFLFGSSDAANAITVDKTPGSLWFMDISVRILGVNSFAVLLPQALMGVATVGLLFGAVKRVTGPLAGIFAGAILALTPVAALIFRFNNPDALLVLGLVAAGWAITRAIADGRTKWLLWCGAFVGVAFLAKMMQAFLVVPGFGLAYLIGGPPPGASGSGSSLRRWVRWSWPVVGGSPSRCCGQPRTARSSAGRRPIPSSICCSATTVLDG